MNASFLKSTSGFFCLYPLVNSFLQLVQRQQVVFHCFHHVQNDLPLEPSQQIRAESVLSFPRTVSLPPPPSLPPAHRDSAFPGLLWPSHRSRIDCVSPPETTVVFHCPGAVRAGNTAAPAPAPHLPRSPVRNPVDPALRPPNRVNCLTLLVHYIVYSSRCLRASKFCLFNGFLRVLNSLDIRCDSIGMPSVHSKAIHQRLHAFPPKMRIRSSSSDRKNRDEPGSPCGLARPRNWLSMRRASSLCSQDMQAAHRDDFVVFRGTLVRELVVDGLPLILAGPEKSSLMLEQDHRHALGSPHFLSVRRANRGACRGVRHCEFVLQRSRVIASGFPPSRMSVPRPAMFVATVTAPLRRLRDNF